MQAYMGHFCKKVNMVVLIILRTMHHRALIFHMLVGLGKNMIPDVFKFARSKVKVTWVTFGINKVNGFYLPSSKLLIITPLGTYTIPIYEVTSGQSTLFYNIFYYSLPVVMNHPSIKTLFDNRSQGGICVVRHFLLSI